MSHELRAASIQKGPAKKPRASLYVKIVILFVTLVLVVGFHYTLRGFQRHPPEPDRYVPVADAQRGPELIRLYGCTSCHVVPGVVGATGKVGPRLDRVNDQLYIAGVLPNSPQNLAYWIRDPQEANPYTAMPDLNVSEQDARDIAAYLYTLP